jgi:hypothetical protein
MAPHVHGPGIAVEAHDVGVDPDADGRETQTTVRKLVEGAEVGVRVGRVAGERVRLAVLAAPEVRVFSLRRKLVEVLEPAFDTVGVDAELRRQLSRRVDLFREALGHVLAGHEAPDRVGSR